MTLDDKVLHAIIANEAALFFNEEIKRTTRYKKELKKKLNLALHELKKTSPDFERLLESAREDLAIDVYDRYYDYIRAIATVPIWEQENMILVIEAFHKDRASMEETVSEILKK